MLDRSGPWLRPDPSRTVVRPFSPDYPARFRQAGASRLQAIVDRVLSLDGAALAREHDQVVVSLDERHRDVDAMLSRRFDDLAPRIAGADAIDGDRRRLIGAYFSEEYAYEAAALFNPSAVLHPDQAGAPAGGVRFAMSLRGIGEGHVSSVAFRTGTWVPGGAPTVDKPSDVAVPPIVEGAESDGKGDVTLRCGGSRELSETVLFPVLPSQRQGIKDVRLVRFTGDDGASTYYATYTAFSGAEARPQMLATDDFATFTMRPLTGDAADAKGMALFPRKVGGRYLMLGRQDSESIWLHASDDLPPGTAARRW